jgi:hypothetical protein
VTPADLRTLAATLPRGEANATSVGKLARLYACRVAEDVLPAWEAKHHDDARPRETIEVARRYANGLATVEELRAAYWAAHSAAYWAARSRYTDWLVWRWDSELSWWRVRDEHQGTGQQTG